MNSSHALTYSPVAHRQMLVYVSNSISILEREKVGVEGSGSERPSIISVVPQPTV